ncbi:MAG: REP-associated tyrosine transposase [Candidatus Acidiferrales bacterium]
MSRPVHRIKAAGAYFVTTSTWQKMSILAKSEAANILIATIQEHRRHGRYFLHDFVVMPDHLHIILTPRGDISLEKAVQLIKGASSREIGKMKTVRHPIWQTGFHEHWIRSVEDYGIHRAYLRNNPVEARLADSAWEFQYSSANGRFELDLYPPPSGAEGPFVDTRGTAGLKPRPAEARREGELKPELPEASAKSALKPRPAEARREGELKPELPEHPQSRRSNPAPPKRAERASRNRTWVRREPEKKELQPNFGEASQQNKFR